MCCIEGCAKPSRGGTEGAMCPMHYHRWYRHGSPNITAATVKTGLGRRYRAIRVPGHPLMGANGRAYEHRVVLYDEIGEGPHPCHWCGVTVCWHKSDGLQLWVDHLNGNGSDNRVENLVPSCPRCNTHRASACRAAALKQLGWWSHHDTVEALGARLDASRFSA